MDVHSFFDRLIARVTASFVDNGGGLAERFRIGPTAAAYPPSSCGGAVCSRSDCANAALTEGSSSSLAACVSVVGRARASCPSPSQSLDSGRSESPGKSGREDSSPESVSQGRMHKALRIMAYRDHSLPVLLTAVCPLYARVGFPALLPSLCQPSRAPPAQEARTLAL